MGLFSNLFKKEPSTEIINLVEKSFKVVYDQSVAFIAKEVDWAVKIQLSEKKELINQSLFECILFNSVVLLSHYQFTLGRRFPEFRNMYYGKLSLFSDANKLTERMPSSLALFIAGKLAHYNKDAESLMNTQVYYYDELAYPRLAYSFFEHPFSLEDNKSSNTSLVLNVSSRTRVMVKKITSALSELGLG